MFHSWVSHNYLTFSIKIHDSLGHGRKVLMGTLMEPEMGTLMAPVCGRYFRSDDLFFLSVYASPRQGILFLRGDL